MNAFPAPSPIEAAVCASGNEKSVSHILGATISIKIDNAEVYRV